MTYAQLSKLNRSELIEAQHDAIMIQDHETLRRIADIMTGFSRLNTETRTDAHVAYLKEEVEDVDFDFDYDECERSFWVG